MPRFSVIVPAFNAERTIASTVRSVLAQTTSEFELIVVDDGSTDGTQSVVASITAADPRVELIVQSNLGPASARNTGIERAGAPYVSFLDSDDLWMPGYLETMGRALDAAPAAAFAYCDAWTLVDTNSRLRRGTELDSRPGPDAGASWEDVFLALASRNFVMCSATVRAEALAETGGFESTITAAEDYDLWFKLLLSGRTAVRGGTQPLLLQRDRGDSLSKNDLLMLEGMSFVLGRVLEDARTPASARPVLEERIRSVRSEIARYQDPRRLGAFSAVLARALRRARDLLRPEGRLYTATPPEVAAAFPELARSPTRKPQG
jgi:glycosyltransferase involved in cell wall biosynthesis